MVQELIAVLAQLQSVEKIHEKGTSGISLRQKTVFVPLFGTVERNKQQVLVSLY